MSVTPPGPVRSVSPVEAERLVREGRVRVVDVRTPAEYGGLGHIPGAILLPVDLVPVAPATLPAEGAPLLVVCEHGVRSAHAAEFLARAGFPGVLNMSGGMSRWGGPREHTPGDPYRPAGPASWLVENARLLPRGGRVLDVACGAGRHALLMAAAGYQVDAIDRDADRIAVLAAAGGRLGLPLVAQAVDLEAGTVDLGREVYDVVMVFNYLHRPLFPAIIGAMRPDGILLYETFTVDQAQRGHPRNPAFLLGHGELARLVDPLEILDKREGEYDGAFVSGVAARKPRR